MKKPSCLLTVFSVMLIAAVDVFAGEWEYQNHGSYGSLRHNEMGWGLNVTAVGTSLTVFGVWLSPSNPSPLPLGDAIVDGYYNECGSIVAVGDQAFIRCQSLTSVNVGYYVKHIGVYAFFGCTNLTNVTVWHSVTNISNNAFASCTSLTNVTIGEGVTHIGKSVFGNCDSLACISVYQYNPFYSGVDGVLFNKNVTTLIHYPSGRSGSAYAIPGGVSHIGDGAFSNCKNLAVVTIPDGMTNIGEWAFAGCIGLTGVTIPDRVTSIGEYAFHYCTGLTDVTIPGSVTSLGNGAFCNCPGLTNVVIRSGVRGIRTDAFSSCTSLASVTIPDSVTSIDNGAFSGCIGLTSVTIPDRVTSIGEYAFNDCTGLTDMTIPDSVTSIGDGAFCNCGLARVLFLGPYPGNVGTNLYLYTPVGATTYVSSKHASSWDSHVSNGPVSGGNAVWQGRPISIMWPNQPPLVSTRSPVGNPAAVTEGTSVVFNVTADDSTDRNMYWRGMSNITWYVDGVQHLVTWAGTSNALASAFTLKTDSNTVRGVAFLDMLVTAVAMDKQGCTTETNWTVRVNNVPAAQAITFPALPVKVIGDPDFATGARVSSGLPIVYSNANPAVVQVVDGVINIVGAGTAVITAGQPGNFDFKAATPVKQTVTVKARLTTAISGNGTVTVSPSSAWLYAPGTKIALTAKPATGSTFLRWEDGSQTTARSLVMPNANLTVSAWFGTTTNVPKPVIVNPGPQRAMVGIPFQLPLDVTSDSLPTITVAGLPTGLSYSAPTKTIIGVPTVSVTNRTVTVTAKNVNKTPATQTFTMTVDPLPAWAQGNFNGWFGGAAGDGPISGDVTAQGKVSGKFSALGTNYTFRAASYARRDGDGTFWVTTTASVAKVSMPLTLAVRNPAGVVPPNLSIADVWFAVTADGDPDAALWRNVWKDAGMAAVATNYTGYYTATLPGTSEYGSGYLLFTVDKLGGVKTTGKLADGSAVSLSGVLILDETGRVFAVLYTAPAAYKGGGLFGVAEFFKADVGAKVIVRLLDGEPFVWESLSPTATQVYAAGFSRDLGLSGGWYDTLGNLYAYYSNRVMTVGTEGVPAPEILVGTNRYDSVCWNPDGLALTVVTNRAGVMTGFSAPKAGAPVKVGAAYDYANPTNTVGLTIALTRATGVFKGSFKAWFDYVTKHTSKSITYEGVLTPERENMDDGIAGRGFFLWADKSQYHKLQGKPVPYSFSWSYDLLLRAD